MRHAGGAGEGLWRGAAERLRSVAVLLGLAAMCAWPAPAEATFPGANGKIVFVRDGAIRTVNPDGSGDTFLASGNSPAWSADGRRIAFELNGDIHTMNADGSGLTRLLNDTVTDTDPAWSPDGSKITFVRHVASVFRSRLFTMNPDGSGLTNISGESGGDFSVGAPEWSPDGTEIGYGWCGNIGPQIHAGRPDGAGFRFIVGGTCTGPTWSPDGARIAFAHEQDSNIYTAPSNGNGSYANLTNSYFTYPSQRALHPTWSPDGARIAFVRSCSGSPCDEAIYSISVDGSDLRRITTGREPHWQTVDAAGDIAVTNVDSPDAVGVSQTLTYTITVKNRGAATATDVNLTQTLQPDTTFQSASPSQGSCSEAGGSVSCALGELPGGGAATVVVRVTTSPEPSVITSTVTATATEPDPNPHNNSATARTNPGYPRPIGGVIFRTPLAIAYEPCQPGAANQVHGGGLTGSSCNPAVQSSPYLTVGSTDANGIHPRAAGSTRYHVCVNGYTGVFPCNAPEYLTVPDLRVRTHITDVRCKLGTGAGQGRCEGGPLSDYTGQLLAVTRLRITDKHNSDVGSTNSRDSATVVDLPLRVMVMCFAEPGGGTPTAIGSTCQVDGAVNDLYPGLILSGRRMNIELGQIEILDGGLDGSTDTGDTTVFARQGVFIP